MKKVIANIKRQSVRAVQFMDYGRSRMSMLSNFQCKECGTTFSAPKTIKVPCPSCSSTKTKSISETKMAMSKLKKGRGK